MAKSNGAVLPLPSKMYKYDNRGRLLTHIDLHRNHDLNPREKSEYEEGKLNKMINSIGSSKYGGIHMAVSTYIKDTGNPQTNYLIDIEGHLRVAACRALINRAKSSGMSPQEIIDQVEKYSWILTTIEKYEDELDILIRMQTSNSLKRQWTDKLHIEHVANIYDAMVRRGDIASLDQIESDHAAAIGLDKSKFATMVTVRKSPSLWDAVGKNPQTTWKGWLSIVRIGRSLLHKRCRLMEDMTGIDKEDRVEFLEAIFELVVKKVAYYSRTGEVKRQGKKKAQSGSLLERCVPVVNNKQFPDSRVRMWLMKDIDITPDHIERYTNGDTRNNCRDRFLVLVASKQYDPKLSEEELRRRLKNLPTDSNINDDPDDTPPANTVPANNGPDNAPSVSGTKAEPIKVAPHSRSQPVPKSPLEKKIIIPKIKDVVYDELVRQFEEIARSPEVQTACNATQKAFLTAAFATLSQGLKLPKAV